MLFLAVILVAATVFFAYLAYLFFAPVVAKLADAFMEPAYGKPWEIATYDYLTAIKAVFPIALIIVVVGAFVFLFLYASRREYTSQEV